MRTAILILGVTMLFASSARADDVGCVSTDVRMLGLANDKVCVASFADPKVPGVACWISRAQTGGVKGAIGIAENPSEFSISCHQTGPISFDPNIKDGEKVFVESTSFWFKTLQVVRFFDKANNTLVYMSYSDKLIEGSPKNSVSAIPIMVWPTK